MISFERSEKEIKERKSHAPHPTFSSTDSDSKTIFCFATEIPQQQLHNLERAKGKIKFCSHICSCFVTADCQIHFTHATDFFRINRYIRSWRSIWRLNGSEDKTYHRGGQNANRGQMCFIIP